MKKEDVKKVRLISFQEQASKVQTQLNEEEMKNSRLVQQIAKLEEQMSVLSQQCDRKDEVGLAVLAFHYAVASCLKCCTEHCAVLMQVLSTERASRNMERHDLQDAVSKLQESLRSEQQSAEGE